MPEELATVLKKQITDLEAKGAMRSRHETLTLENARVKIKAMQDSQKEKSK